MGVKRNLQDCVISWRQIKAIKEGNNSAHCWCYSDAVVLSLGTVDILGQIIMCCGVCPVYCTKMSSNSVLHPQMPQHPLPSCDMPNVLVEADLTLIENHCARLPEEPPKSHPSYTLKIEWDEGEGLLRTLVVEHVIGMRFYLGSIIMKGITPSCILYR